MRKHGRTDANQSAIVTLFREMGCSVWVTSSAGNGAPDIVIGANGKNVLVEIKDGSKAPFAHRLTMAEQKFHDEWRGDIRIIKTEMEALQLIKSLRS